MHDQEYRVTYGDPGVGGLIFMLDVMEKMKVKLKKIEQKRRIKFIFDHLGDSENLPYSTKNVEDISRLTKRFLEYQLALPNVRTAVIACNTASTVFDENMKQYFKEKYPEINIISMIETSAKAMVDEGKKHGKNSEFAIFATSRTINSQSYQNEISKTSSNHISTYIPYNWAKNIEFGLDKEASNKEIEKDLAIFKEQVGQNFSKIKVVGLFCTHYPFYRNEIKSFFNKNGNQDAVFLSQGYIFSQEIYNDILKNLAKEKNTYKKRAEKIPYECIREIELQSIITGDNLAEVRNVINNTYPQYLEKISFQKINLKQ